VARHKEFDVDIALMNAMNLFGKGTRAHLSARFGHKRSLFPRALNQYADSTEAADRQKVAEAGNALEAVRRLLFESSVDQSDARPSGCL
jgi:hypothetical protein